MIACDNPYCSRPADAPARFESRWTERELRDESGATVAVEPTADPELHCAHCGGRVLENQHSPTLTPSHPHTLSLPPAISLSRHPASSLSPGRRGLWGLVGALVTISVLPALLGWRHIAAYAAIPELPAETDRVVQLTIPGAPPLSGGQGLAVAGDGAIFVVDQNFRRLLVFPDGRSPSGRVLAPQPGQPPLTGPYGLALGPSDRVYLLDNATGFVHVYERSGRVVRSSKLGSPGARAVAVDAAGNVYVADTGAQAIRKLLPNDQPDATWGDGVEPGTVRLPEVVGIAVAGGELFVASGARKELLRLDGNGRLARRERLLGNAGMLTAVGDAPAVEAATLVGATVFMSDLSTNRVWAYDRDGRLVGRVVGADGNQEPFFQPRGLAATKDGFLYAVNENRITVYRLMSKD